MSELLHLSHDVSGTELAVAPALHEARGAALKAAAEITTVVDSWDAEVATDAVRQCKNLAKEVEAARKQVKQPILDLGRKIDDTSKEFSKDLNAQVQRLERLLGAYQAAEREKAEKARRAALEEERKIREAAQREAAEAFTDEEAEQALNNAADQVSALRQQNTTLDYKPAGTALLIQRKFEVEDIDALFQARPELCKIEPNNEAIRSLLKVSKKLPSIPGIRAWEEAKSSIR
ncbi:MAG: hypothetical protein Q7P63_01280 [Verrucomicrobiota bacterium JB022]|nr:hypothetical protein [Verrucomicrobiota bacterium JB022]